MWKADGLSTLSLLVTTNPYGQWNFVDHMP
jgi:hypothetical protein